MIPLVVLVAVTVVARALGEAGVEPLDDLRTSLRLGLAAMLVLTASAHFGSRRDDLVAMVPAALPRPDVLVTVTGVPELVIAAAMLVPSLARWGAAALGVLLVAMFPANVRAARERLSIGGRPATPLGPRAAIQAVFLAAAGLAV